MKLFSSSIKRRTEGESGRSLPGLVAGGLAEVLRLGFGRGLRLGLRPRGHLVRPRVRPSRAWQGRRAMPPLPRWWRPLARFSLRLPSFACNATRPVAAATISVETLSVSRVSSGSLARTWSPSCLCHAAMIPLEMDSPTEGILTSMLMEKRGTTHQTRGREWLQAQLSETLPALDSPRFSSLSPGR